MRDNGLYATILGITSPWSVTDVRLQPPKSLVEVQVTLDPLHALLSPVCATPARRYDSRERRWRHLDTCQYRTLFVADVPRVECSEHGVHQTLSSIELTMDRLSVGLHVLTIRLARSGTARHACLRAYP